MAFIMQDLITEETVSKESLDALSHTLTIEPIKLAWPKRLMQDLMVPGDRTGARGVWTGTKQVLFCTERLPPQRPKKSSLI